jgi:hypothetical protein
MNINEKIKSRLGIKGGSEHRAVFGKAKKVMPWYSINRTRNQLILAVISVSIVFSNVWIGVYNGFKNGIRFDREMAKFKEQLDREERELDELEQEG